MKKLLLMTSLVLTLGLLVMSCTDSTPPTQQNSATGFSGNAKGGGLTVQSNASQAAESGGNGQSDRGSMAASGHWIDCNIVTDFKQVGPNQIITVNISETFYGTLEGCYAGTERDVVYKNGSATFHGRGIFTGVVNGQSGTMVMTYEGTVNTQGVGSAHWVLGRGTGGLGNLHGQGTFDGILVALQTSRCTPADPTVCDGGMYGGSYSGNLHFGGHERHDDD